MKDNYGIEEAMKEPDVKAGRRHLAALTQLFVRHVGRGADLRALRRALMLAHAASEALNDDYCREKLRLVARYGAELLANAEHEKWASGSLSGAEFLRQQVLNALELVASRLYSLEMLMRIGPRATASMRRSTTVRP